MGTPTLSFSFVKKIGARYYIREKVQSDEFLGLRPVSILSLISEGTYIVDIYNTNDYSIGWAKREYIQTRTFSSIALARLKNKNVLVICTYV